jgi:monoamine oxidase
MAFLHSQKEDAAFPTWWTMLPVRSNMLIGWAGGPAASRLTGKRPEMILRLAVADLARVTGLKEREIALLVESCQVFDWPSDPFARGAYSYPALGGVEAIAQLARPIRKTLFFAGEATHPGMSGTVAGAISSGHRAAKQVLESI